MQLIFWLFVILQVRVIHAVGLEPRQSSPLTAVNKYDPVPGKCPSTSLVRQARGVSSPEANYVTQRKSAATASLKRYLATSGATFPSLNDDAYPTIGLASSGGGLRALLSGAGVIKSFDDREAKSYSTSGLYQALTYESGLSGGGWLLSAIAANNFPTISKLQSQVWEKTFPTNPVSPGGAAKALAYPVISFNIAAKADAGFDVTIIDPYGRQTGYSVLGGVRGGILKRFSDVSTFSSFTSHQAPYPIITSLGINRPAGECTPSTNATQYETSPFEFGSWDKGVSAFTQTKYLGSALTNGKPTTNNQCYTNFDQQSFIMGTSANIFPAASCLATDPLNDALDPAIDFLQDLIPGNDTLSTNPDLVYALYPNPFYRRPASNLVANQEQLALADGGIAGQNNPIWPFLNRPGVNVLFVNDNSADTSDNFPDGSGLRGTYDAAQSAGLGARMPFIPPVSTFTSQGLNKRPTVFGCNGRASALTIVYLPNRQYSFDSGQSTFRLQYSRDDVRNMITNGAQVGSFDGAEGWGTCVGCFVMKKAVQGAGKTLPNVCRACVQRFCFN